MAFSDHPLDPIGFSFLLTDSEPQRQPERIQMEVTNAYFAD